MESYVVMQLMTVQKQLQKSDEVVTVPQNILSIHTIFALQNGHRVRLGCH